VSGQVVHLVKVAGIAGAETHLLSLLPGLRRRGWDVRLLMLHEGEAGAGEFALELAGRGVPVEAIRLRADVDPRAFARLTFRLARRRPVLLHTHLVHADVYGQPAAWLARVPVRFSTKHGFNEFRENPRFALADRLVGGLADTHVAVSRGLAQYLAATEGFEQGSFEIAHYGVRVEPPAPCYDGPPRLLAIGRLIPIKGHFVLLRAMALALAQVPDLELRLAGAGPLEATLRTFATELGIADRVRLLGRVEPVRPAIEDSSLVVVPSLGEGFGLVALEAMERSRAVVASAVGGLLDLVADGETGLLVPPRYPVALRAAIDRLLADRELRRRLGEAGRARIRERFSWAAATDATLEAYADTLRR